MGKVAKITTSDGSVFTLSMIKWGVLRRTYFQALPATARLTRFIPRYEIAIYDGRVGLKPYLTILYADEETANKGWDELPKSIKKFGLGGLQVISQLDNPTKEVAFHP